MDLHKLHEIDEGLTKSEVAALKFLCVDFLGKKHLETVKDAKDLFRRLDEQALFDDQLLLPELLYTIGRHDLLAILGTNRKDVSRLLQVQRSCVSAYRKMLYKLSEDITDENLHNIKFLLSDLPKSKLNSATFLDVLAEMEKMDMLGKDNLDELENVLNRCSRDLANKVLKFKDTQGTREQEHRPDPTNDRYPHQEETFTSQLTNISIAETDPTPRSSLRSEIIVDTDSQAVSTSETAQRTAINEDDFYPMTRRPSGHCLIINNYNFAKTSKLSNRKGTESDKAALTRVFERMHFVVEEKGDLLSSDMLKTVMEFSKKDHTQMDAFVCCILSHGEKGAVLGIDGKPVPIRDLTQPFARCLTLTSKPKLFFIQACQGTMLQQGVLMEDGNEEGEYDEDAQRSGISVPIEADFLIGMATVEHYKSFRHTVEGSIFIQELCTHLENGCPNNEDILSILTKVNRSVSAKILKGHKQMPEPRYTLTKKLVLPMD